MGGARQIPPALRKVNYRELLMISEALNQVGLPCSINTDASLGWAVYCYRSFEVLFNQCQGDRSILLRLEGHCSRGSGAPRNNTAQRAKCGYCPCCNQITQVFAPPSSAIGKSDQRKLNGARPWQQYGPIASKVYAAALYRNHNKGISEKWNWIRGTHNIALPPLLDPHSQRARLRP